MEHTSAIGQFNHFFLTIMIVIIENTANIESKAKDASNEEINFSDSLPNV